MFTHSVHGVECAREVWAARRALFLLDTVTPAIADRSEGPLCFFNFSFFFIFLHIFIFFLNFFSIFHFSSFFQFLIIYFFHFFFHFSRFFVFSLFFIFTIFSFFHFFVFFFMFFLPGAPLRQKEPVTVLGSETLAPSSMLTSALPFSLLISPARNCGRRKRLGRWMSCSQSWR